MTSALDIAREYLDRGWSVVPVRAGEKNPGFEGWPQLRLKVEDLPKRFNGNGVRQNIGVLLGEPSRGLVDIDLDVAEACSLGDVLLPQTDAIFGRAGKPCSHYLYLATEPAIPKSMQLDWPGKVVDGKPVRIIELRSTKLHTVFPGSQHETGEDVRWDAEGEPATVATEALTRVVQTIAAGVVLLPYWQQGRRNKMALALGGAMLRSGWSVEDTAELIGAIASVAGDEEAASRRQTVRQTKTKLEEGCEATGLRTLAEIVGDEVVVRQLRAWLQLGAMGAAGARDRTQQGVGDDRDRAKDRKDGQADADGQARTGDEASTQQEDAGTRLYVARRLSEITPRPWEWVWPGRIARGALTLVVGDGGVGKSWFTVDLAARLSTGTPLPGETERPPRLTTVLLDIEDDPERTIRPRADALHCDTDRVIVWDGVRRDGRIDIPQLDRDLSTAEQLLTEYQAGVFVIDPVNAYMGSTKGFNDIEVRQILTPVVALAARLNVAVLAIMHVKKGEEANALHKALGSVAYGNLARSVLLVGRDPEVENRRLLLQAKVNIAGLAPGLGFRIDETGPHWDGDPVTATAESVFGATTAVQERESAQEHRSALEDAVDFLRTLLKQEGGRCWQKTIEDEAGDCKHSWATVRRAKDRLGVASVRRTVDGATRWYWELTAVKTEDETEAIETARREPDCAAPASHAGALAAQGAQGAQGAHIHEQVSTLSTLAPSTRGEIGDSIKDEHLGLVSHQPCWTCKSTLYWMRPEAEGSGPVCAQCHPQPATGIKTWN